MRSLFEGLCHCQYGPAALLLMTVMQLKGAEFTWMVLTEMKVQVCHITRILETLATSLHTNSFRFLLSGSINFPSCRKAKMSSDPSILSSFQGQLLVLNVPRLSHLQHIFCTCTNYQNWAGSAIVRVLSQLSLRPDWPLTFARVILKRREISFTTATKSDTSIEGTSKRHINSS